MLGVLRLSAAELAAHEPLIDLVRSRANAALATAGEPGGSCAGSAERVTSRSYRWGRVAPQPGVAVMIFCMSSRRQPIGQAPLEWPGGVLVPASG